MEYNQHHPQGPTRTSVCPGRDDGSHLGRCRHMTGCFQKTGPEYNSRRLRPLPSLHWRALKRDGARERGVHQVIALTGQNQLLGWPTQNRHPQNRGLGLALCQQVQFRLWLCLQSNPRDHLRDTSTESHCQVKDHPPGPWPLSRNFTESRK